MVNVLKDFYVITVARENIRLVSLNAIPTDRPTPLVNEAMETHSVITLDVTRPVSNTPVIASNRFIFLLACHGLQFHQAIVPQF